MARAVAARGHTVEIQTTDRAMTDAEKKHYASPVVDRGVTIHVHKQGVPATLAVSWPLARALDKAIPAADVVHIHSLYLFHVWYAARVARKAGKPYLLRPHGTLDPFLWKRHRLRKAFIETLFQDRVIDHAAALHWTAAEEMELAAPIRAGQKAWLYPTASISATMPICRRPARSSPSTRNLRARSPRCSCRGSISKRVSTS